MKRVPKRKPRTTFNVWVWPALFQTKLQNPTFGGSWVWAKKRSPLHVRATLTLTGKGRKDGK